MSDKTQNDNLNADNANTEGRFDQSGPQRDPDNEAAKLHPTERKAKPGDPAQHQTASAPVPKGGQGVNSYGDDMLERDAKTP